ncbi:TadE/TadG family type IV pilus assembly protein [Lacibacterium aquatile]|uniref:TadE/TadG family type IV pilus assembly protein n=1 Tax=Lacibacterium aquatile TaxID=1168082 RepID=A0ABW5DWJ1_9PROT
MAARSLSRLDRSGATAIEVALLLPLFLMIVLGGLDIGLWLLQSARLSEAARRAARAAVITAPVASLSDQGTVSCRRVSGITCSGGSIIAPDSFDRIERAADMALADGSMIVTYRLLPDGSSNSKHPIVVIDIKNATHTLIFMHIIPGIGRTITLATATASGSLPRKAYR